MNFLNLLVTIGQGQPLVCFNMYHKEVDCKSWEMMLKKFKGAKLLQRNLKLISL